MTLLQETLYLQIPCSSYLSCVQFIPAKIITLRRAKNRKVVMFKYISQLRQKGQLDKTHKITETIYYLHIPERRVQHASQGHQEGMSYLGFNVLN